MFTLAFWRAAFERAISTAAQAALALLGADGLGILDVDWRQTGSVVGLAFLLAILKALAAAGVGNNGPGFGAAETLTHEVAAETEPSSPTGLAAGPAADVPEGAPVSVQAAITETVQEVLAQPYAGDSKTGATYHGGGE